MPRILTPDDITVIRERHFGWEKAPAKLLAAIFGVSAQRITAVLRQSTHHTPDRVAQADCVPFHASEVASHVG